MTEGGTAIPQHGSLCAFRNSEGLTPAESWRKDADRLMHEARALNRQAAEKERQAGSYRDLAAKWNEEHGVRRV